LHLFHMLLWIILAAFLGVLPFFFGTHSLYIFFSRGGIISCVSVQDI
jgi:hypothetical protein